MIDEGSWDMPFSLLLDSVYTMQFLTFQTGWAFQYLMKILQMSYSVFTKHSLGPLFAQASNKCYSTVHSVDKVVSWRNRKQHLNLVIEKKPLVILKLKHSTQSDEKQQKPLCSKTPSWFILIGSVEIRTWNLANDK